MSDLSGEPVCLSFEITSLENVAGLVMWMSLAAGAHMEKRWVSLRLGTVPDK